MSTIANWTYTSIATFWRVGEPDKYGDVTYSAPVRIMCAFRRGGKRAIVNSRGNEFVPKMTFWTELIDADTGLAVEPPSIDDIIVAGSHSDAEPVSGSFAVSSIVEDDMSAMMAGLNDFEINCE